MIKTGAVYFLYRFFNDNPEATIEEGYEVYKQALEMENKINQEYYNQGVQDCKNTFEKIISDVTGNIPNL
jgi:uncharacterized protein (DUF2164 family)